MTTTGHLLATAALLALMTSAHAADRLIILSGQSNMDGRVGAEQGRKEDPQAFVTPTNVLYFKDNGKTPIAFEKLEKFAIEVTFAQALARQYPDDRIILVKFAVGGTGIRSWQAPVVKEKPLVEIIQEELKVRAKAIAEAETAGQPVPPAPKNVSLYKTLLTAIVNVRNQYPKAQPQAFIWIQGESDGGNKENAEAYAERFKALIASIRRDVGVEKLPVILGSPYVKKEDKLLGTYNDIVRVQQKAAAEADPTVHLIDIQPLNPTGAGHYSAKANLELGRLMGAEFVKTQSKE